MDAFQEVQERGGRRTKPKKKKLVLSGYEAWVDV
jgi:hypothetical protein